MQAHVDSATVSTQPDLPLLEEVRQQLEAEKVRITEEITSYPRPIPACDAQFNYLLEKRGEVLQELGQMQNVVNQNLTVSEYAETLLEIVSKSHCIDEKLATKVRLLIRGSIAVE